MTADLAGIIAAALDERFARRTDGTTDPIIRAAHAEMARDAVAALDAAKMAGQTRVEWAHGPSDRRVVDWSEQAARRALAAGRGPLWRRGVHVEPWERVDDDA